MGVAFKGTNFVIFCFLLVIGLQECAAEKTIDVKLPSNVSPGDNVLLQCIFDVGNEHFTSVKWTKSDQEFFRYTENESPKIQLFQVAGIQVQENASSRHEVQLINVSTETDGIYTCHVSTEESGILTSRKLDIIAKDNEIEVKVPSPASPGDNVRLQCLFHFKDGGAVSYLKWYKSNEEFFRYTEKASPKIQLFEVPGIHVQTDASSLNEVQLNNVSPETEGTYTCKVSNGEKTILTSQKLDVTAAKNHIEVKVPSPAKSGDNVLLQCLFQFKNGGVATSLKWYKSNEEFFRYTEKATPKIQVFEVAGIQVQTSTSSLHEVQLINVSTETAGTYKCEASTDDTTISDFENLDVTPAPKLTGQEYLNQVVKANQEMLATQKRLLNQGLTFLRP